MGENPTKNSADSDIESIMSEIMGLQSDLADVTVPEKAPVAVAPAPVPTPVVPVQAPPPPQAAPAPAVVATQPTVIHTDADNALLDQLHMSAEDELKKLEDQVKATVDAALDVADMEKELQEAEIQTDSTTDEIQMDEALALQGTSTPDQITSMEGFSAGKDDASMEEILAGMPDEETSQGGVFNEPPSPPVFHDRTNVLPMRSQQPPELESGSQSNHSSSEGNSMSMTLTGEMKLKLVYAFSGQEVTVSFDDGALKVSLADGTEFKVPVRRQNSKNVA